VHTFVHFADAYNITLSAEIVIFVLW